MVNRKGAIHHPQIDYYLIVEKFMTEKLQPRIRTSGIYSDETMRMLTRLEWELSELIGAQWNDNHKELPETRQCQASAPD